MRKDVLKRCIAGCMSLLVCFGAYGTVCAGINSPTCVTAYAITAEQKDFINKLGDAAQKNYSVYGILPSMTVAQAILESGWGKSSLSKLYYNFFGMKAGTNYTGKKVTVKTGEEVNGVLITVNGTFRVYDSFEDGIEGYYKFITGYQRYANLIGETDYKKACQKIKQDGWATDSGYTNKLINLIETYDLTRFDKGYEPPPPGEYFPSCSSAYTSLVEALASVGAQSSKEYRAQIAAANNIQGYSYTAEQNLKMLELLKQGKLRIPKDGDVPVIIDKPVNTTYYPQCSDSYLSLVDALNSMNIDSSKEFRKKIAEANGLGSYSYSAEENTYLLGLLKAGKLLNPNVSKPITPDMYYPACSSEYVSLVEALESIGVDSSKSYRAKIAQANGITNYDYSAEDNTKMLDLLKAGKLVKADYSAAPAIVNYTVTLDPAGGTSGVSSLSVQSDNKKYENLPTPSREGYSFAGWFTSASGGSQITDGTAMTVSSDHIIYAHWTPNKYKVTLNASDATDSTTEKTVTFNGKYGELDTPTLKGYDFAGWYTELNGGTKVTADTVYTHPDNSTLYARWTPKESKVSFDLNGGTGTAESFTVRYERRYGELSAPERKNYNFDGWFTAKEGGQMVTADSFVYATVDHVLYAHWSKIELDIGEAELTLTNGSQHTIQPNITDVTYKTSDDTVAVVSRDGKVTAVGTGSAVISVITTDYDVKQLKVTVIPPKGIKGDCNNDGYFTTADLVTLKRYLLGAGDLPGWENIDLCSDGRIDVYDMTAARKLLLE